MRLARPYYMARLARPYMATKLSKDLTLIHKAHLQIVSLIIFLYFFEPQQNSSTSGVILGHCPLYLY